MEHELANSEAPRDQASVLATGAAEDDHAVRSHIVTATDGDLLNRRRHVLDGDAEESFRHLFRRSLDANPCELRRDLVELFPHRRFVERERETVGGDAA